MQFLRQSRLHAVCGQDLVNNSHWTNVVYAMKAFKSQVGVTGCHSIAPLAATALLRTNNYNHVKSTQVVNAVPKSPCTISMPTLWSINQCLINNSKSDCEIILWKHTSVMWCCLKAPPRLEAEALPWGRIFTASASVSVISIVFVLC